MSAPKVWVVLLRAVNVGGTGKLAMADLAALCRKLGYESVRTYIASGNVVFRASGSESGVKKAMEGELERLMGRSPGVLVRTGAEMAAVAAANPFADAPTNRVVAVFLDRRPPPGALEAAKGRVEEVLALGAREIYVHYPEGQGTSRLKIPAAEQGTARNMNTVAKLAQLAAELCRVNLGISSYTYTWAVGVKGSEPGRPMTAFDLLHLARDLGVGVVQYADNLPLDRLAEADLGALLRDAGPVAIEVGTRGIDPANLDRYLSIATTLGSPILRVVVDTPDHHPQPEEIVRTLRGFLPALDRAGVTLAIENHDRFRVSTLAEIVRSLGHPRVGICLDTVNSFGAMEGPEVVVEALAPHVANLHVKDFDIQRAWHNMGFVVEGRPAGQGRLDVPWIISRLRAAGRDPNAILELWTPRQPDLAATIRLEAQWAVESVAYLKGLIPVQL